MESVNVFNERGEVSFFVWVCLDCESTFIKDLPECPVCKRLQEICEEEEANASDSG
jgi:rubrerythrin